MITFAAKFMSRLAPKLTRRVPYLLQAPCAPANIWSRRTMRIPSRWHTISVPALLKGNVGFTFPESVHRMARHHKL